MFTFFWELPFSYRISLVSLVGTLLFKIYLIATLGVCRSTKKLHGKTIIITGASGGIGKETALDLASRGARVILACRNIHKADSVKGETIFSLFKINQATFD